MKSFGVVVLLLLSSCLARSAPITGVRQTWTYDAETHKGTLHVENISHQKIVAFGVGEYATYKDGRQFVLGEKIHIDELFLPGEARDETIDESIEMIDGLDLSNPNSVKAEVDMVVYEDDTAEVNNRRAFDHLMENRRAQVEALKTASVIIQKSLDDPEVTDHHAAIVAELKRQAMLAKSQERYTLSSLLDVQADEVPKNKADLPEVIKRNDQKIAELEPHTNVKITTTGEKQ